MFVRSLLVALALLAWPSVASADPCEGELPRRADVVFSGLVRYVGDGDSLCVGESDDSATWIEVRLADFDAPELYTSPGERAYEALSSLALGRRVRCTTVHGRNGRVVSYDRVHAVCMLGSESIGERLRGRSRRSN